MTMEHWKSWYIIGLKVCVWWCNSEAIVSGPVSLLAGSALLLPVPPVFVPTYLPSVFKRLTDEGIKASEHPFP